MTDNLRFRIVGLLSRDINKLYSISELSKELGSAYSHCNKFVKELVEENVIRLVKIANAHICQLNLRNNLTLSYLSFNEYNKLEDYKKKNKVRFGKMMLFVSRIKEKDIPIDTLFLSGTQIMIVASSVDKNIMKRISDEKLGISYMLIDRKKFKSIQEKVIEEHHIFYGAERFWEMIEKKVKIEV